MSDTSIKKFKKNIWDFYHDHKREMPWRDTRDPYKILVSEVMLQQTQVSRVLKKYPEFIKAFPNPEILAKAPLTQILAVWQGMGYNRRALALKAIANKVVRGYKGVVPRDHSLLIKLPGIGENTAGAIVAFAFNIPVAFIETNIRRVYIHFFFKKSHSVSDKEILKLVKKTVDIKNPREWYYALMDYGAMLAKITKNPNQKSRHYTKQKPFKGSNREVRGLILNLLLQGGSLSNTQLATEIRRRRVSGKVTQNLNDLVDEGFLSRKGSNYSLSH